MEKIHIPVLKKEVIEYLVPKRNENFVDCTFGEGGHTIEILKRTEPRGKVLAIEVDPDLYKKGKILEKKFKGRLILKKGNFSELKKIVKEAKIERICGILFDLGISLWHIEKSKRGFSFLRDEPLIMRYDKDLTKLTAIDILNKYPERKIEEILKNFGQERYAKKIARQICKVRKKERIETTFQLVEIVKRAVPKFYLKRKLHFATKTFLALRIFINEELENLKKGLSQSLEILEKRGRLVVISFHSLEDKIVKDFFKKKSKEGKLEILTKKPISPKIQEILKNKRARSAKLRAAKKL